MLSPESFWSPGVAWPALMLCWVPESIHSIQCLQISQECDTEFGPRYASPLQMPQSSELLQDQPLLWGGFLVQ